MKTFMPQKQGQFLEFLRKYYVLKNGCTLHIYLFSENTRCVYRVLVEKSEGKEPLGDPGLDGRIILSWIFRKWDVRAWAGSSWLMIRTVGGDL
jgi:hypothetical protein